MEFLVEYTFTYSTFYYNILYIFSEEELGLEDQAIIRKGSKLYLVLSKILDEAKRKNPDKLRMLLTYICT